MKLQATFGPSRCIAPHRNIHTLLQLKLAAWLEPKKAMENHASYAIPAI